MAIERMEVDLNMQVGQAMNEVHISKTNGDPLAQKAALEGLLKIVGDEPSGPEILRKKAQLRGDGGYPKA